MKKFLLSALFLASFLVANAQDQKKTEHVIEVAGGLSWNDDDTDRAGVALSIGYGIDIKLNNDISIMPMIGYRETSESLIRSGWDGVSLNDFSFIDFSVSGCYHCPTGKNSIVVGVGPYVSFIQNRDKYSIDSDPNSKLNGKYKLKTIDFGLMPTITFNVARHLSLGAKMTLGLTDSSEHYREIIDQEPRYLKSFEMLLRYRL